MTAQVASEPRILIIGPSWVGDMVMAQSLFMTIKAIQPKASIDVLAPAWSRPIIERMPEVACAIDMPLGHGSFGLGSRRALGHKLRANGYSQSIVLPNSWKSALIPWFANIPTRTGWKGEARYGLLNDLRKLDKNALPLMVQRFVALAHPKGEAMLEENIAQDQCPAPRLKANQTRLPDLLGELKLNQEKPILVLCPGAEFGPAKQWPAEHFSSTAIEMLERGFQVWLMGSKGDVEIAQEIHGKVSDSKGSHDIVNLCGKTSLEDAIDLMSIADKVVSNDSGLMHIASALDRPVVALYGATSPDFTPPLSENATVIAQEVDCGPCFQRQCPEGHHKCLQDLNPIQVIKVLEEEN